MPAYRYPLIAREGWLLILAVVLIAGVLHYGQHNPLEWPFWGLALGFVFLFRDPPRKVPPLPLAIVSPADGRVVSVEKVRDPYLDREAVNITLEMSFLDIYSIRSPMEGKVQQQWYPHAGVEPNTGCYAQWVQSDEKDDVVLAVSGHGIRRPRCYIHAGERIGQGQRCGLVRFGSRLQVFVPENSQLKVKSGERVRAGTSVLANLTHP